LRSDRRLRQSRRAFEPQKFPYHDDITANFNDTVSLVKKLALQETKPESLSLLKVLIEVLR